MPIRNPDRLNDALSRYDSVRCRPHGYDVRICGGENVSHFEKASCTESRASDTGIRSSLPFAMSSSCR